MMLIEMSGWLDLKCTVIKGGMKILPAIGPSPLVSFYDGTSIYYRCSAYDAF